MWAANQGAAAVSDWPVPVADAGTASLPPITRRSVSAGDHPSSGNVAREHPPHSSTPRELLTHRSYPPLPSDNSPAAADPPPEPGSSDSQCAEQDAAHAGDGDARSAEDGQAPVPAALGRRPRAPRNTASNAHLRRSVQGRKSLAGGHSTCQPRHRLRQKGPHAPATLA